MTLNRLLTDMLEFPIAFIALIAGSLKETDKCTIF